MSDLPQPADSRHLRVSDSDREQATEVLRQAAGDGRITFDELDQRLEVATTTTTTTATAKPARLRTTASHRAYHRQPDLAGLSPGV